MITNINENLKVCGIYKISYDNGKVYIGQAMSIWSRAHEHNSKNQNLCDKALKKHEATIEVIEEVKDILLLDEIESLWIKYYDATNREKGYNILEEGNASGKQGVNNLNAALNSQQLEEVIDLLINHCELSYKDIAIKYGISSDTILHISMGYRYYNSKLQYPLRKNNHESQLKNKVSDYFTTEEELINLKEDLKYRWDLQIETDLSLKYNIPVRILHEINNGSKFSDYGNYEYPIRKKNIRNNNNFTQEDVINILYDLRYSQNSMTDIGNKFHIHRNTISKINQGQAYIIKDYDYPARKI